MVQNKNGAIEAEITLKQNGCPNPMAAEAQLIIHALMVAHIMELRNIRVNTDCLGIADTVRRNKDSDYKTHLGYKVKHIQKTLTKFDLGDIGYIQRSQYLLFHRLTQLAITNKTQHKAY